MSEDLENIQAKLCAYLEGELDPGERAQIEKHLAANPNDRRLVEEMARARQMMRQLPRQSAPPELAEAIQRQLERSVLLDGDGGSDPAVIGRIGRWPQYAAVAAILLLAVGLGAVVYYVVLPPTGGPVAIMQKPAAAPLTEDGQSPVVIGGDEAVGGAIGAEADAASRRAARERRRAASPLAAKGGAPDAMAKAAPAAPELSADAKDLPPAPQVALNQAAAAPAGIADAAATGPSGYAWAAKAKTGDADRLVLVVSTDNPALTNSQVVHYLTSNSIAWDVAPPTADAAAFPDEQRATLPQNAEQMSRELEQVPVGQVAPAAVANDDDDDAARQTQQITQAQIQRQLVDPYAENQTPLPAQQQQLGQQLSKEAEQLDESLAQQQAVRQQAKALANQPADEQLQPAQSMVQEGLPDRQAFVANRPATAPAVQNAARREQVIVARGMRRSQAIELRDALTAAGQNAGTQQRVLAYLAADGAPRGIALPEALPRQQALAAQPLALPSSRETGSPRMTTAPPAHQAEEQPVAAARPAPAPADAEKPVSDQPTTEALAQRTDDLGRRGEQGAAPGAGMARGPATAPVAPPLAATIVAPGDLLSIEIGDPARAGMLRVQVVPVHQDGTAALPRLGDQVVAGRTFAELEQQIQASLEGSNTAGAQVPGPVAVRRIGPSAALRQLPAAPADPASVPPPPREESATVTTQPAATAPASPPAAKPAAAADTPVDVVIVVQDAPAPAPAASDARLPEPPAQPQQDLQADAPDPAAIDAPSTAPVASPASPAASQPAPNP